jgi:hypothetical protein
MMYRKSRIVDVIAGVGLLGMVALSAAAQVGPIPKPVMHWCPPGTAEINGVTYEYEGKWCPEGTGCSYDYWVDENGVWGVYPLCSTLG